MLTVSCTTSGNTHTSFVGSRKEHTDRVVKASRRVRY